MNSDYKLLKLWNYSTAYDKAMMDWCDKMRASLLGQLSRYDIFDAWYESDENARAFIEWVKAQDTEQLVAELFRTEESK